MKRGVLDQARFAATASKSVPSSKKPGADSGVLESFDLEAHRGPSRPIVAVSSELIHGSSPARCSW